MPLNVRRFYSSIFLTLAIFLTVSYSQVVAPSSIPPANTQTVASQPAVPAPTSGDVMRDRITKAKAYIAVRNCGAAIYELENIRKESSDTAVQGVVNVLLMNSYLELGDYKRAQEFLNKFYAEQKTTKLGAMAAYSAVAGQVVSGARNRAERYKALGIDPRNRMLPLEALNDLERMRETLELVITQSKEIGQTPAKTKDAMAMLEEATRSRAMLARDEYDARRWRDEVGDTREAMASGNMKVLTATTQDGVNGEIAQNTSPQRTVSQASIQSAPQPAVDAADMTTRLRSIADPAPAPSEGLVAKNDKPVYVPVVSSPQPENKPGETTASQQPAPNETAKLGAATSDQSKTDGSPVDVGQTLMAYATRQTQPVYPPAARTMRTTGIVRVDVTVDENGDVVDVQKTTGPSLLQGAAKDAIKKWKFKPFVRDGQAVKANGYVNFSFNL